MKPRGVIPTIVDKKEDIRLFFDGIARVYADQHGNPGKLLKYRTGFIIKEALIKDDDLILEVCCGTGDHLIAIVGESGRGVGIDFSSEMISVAINRNFKSTCEGKVIFQVDDATRLDSILSESVDVAFCVGSLEHIPNKPAVMAAVYRVLKPSGRFVCLTVNGGYLWHRKIATTFGINTRHLSTDSFLKRNEIDNLIKNLKFNKLRAGYWSFVPRGDMPKGFGYLFQFLDVIGRIFRGGSLRGGLFFTLQKP